MVDKDYVVYTGSDPDAYFLIGYLEDKGFTVPSMDHGDSAMVFVMSPSKGKLVRALKEADRESIKWWKVAEVPRPTKVLELKKK